MARAAATLALTAAAAASAQGGAAPQAGPELSLVYNLEAGAQLAGERNLFWRLAERYAPSQAFNPDRAWWEFYVKPGVSARQALRPGLEWYGGLSLVASGTLKPDAFDAGNSGRLSLENAFAGLRIDLGDAGAQRRLDLSAGAQPYVIGTGMLVSNGASNGFDRGALKLGPRKAFEMSAIVRLNQGAWSVQAYLVQPNEQASNDSNNRLIGSLLEYKESAERFAGLAYGRVTRSSSPYPQAAPGGEGPPVLIDGARKGLQLVYGYARWPVMTQASGTLWLGLDATVERHRRLDMQAWAGRARIGYVFKALPGTPKITYSFQTFSGDDPSTPRLERFDPLFYEGSPEAWSTGSKASMVYINTNVRAHQLLFEWTPTPRDMWSLHLARLSANELKSPLQFGQSTRLEFVDGAPSVLAGVTRQHLASDAFLKYVRMLDPHRYLTLGASLSFPGAGIDGLRGSPAPVWRGWLVNVVVAY